MVVGILPHSLYSELLHCSSEPLHSLYISFTSFPFQVTLRDAVTPPIPCSACI